MILYKYMSLEAGLKLLETSTMGFRQPRYFNDPFECMAAYYVQPEPDEIKNVITHQALTRSIHKLKSTYGILSLTRQPTNPLMWSHYADEHKGMVIGIDTFLAGFTDEFENRVPVQYGSVIYTQTKPSDFFQDAEQRPISLSAKFEFDVTELERLQRAFLYKPSDWAYEEEVRVVKCLQGIESSPNLPSGQFKTKHTGPPGNKAPLYLLSIPKHAIKEVYLGLRAIDGQSQAKEMICKIKSRNSGVKILRCKPSNKAWSIDSYDFEEATNSFSRNDDETLKAKKSFNPR